MVNELGREDREGLGEDNYNTARTDATNNAFRLEDPDGYRGNYQLTRRQKQKIMEK